MTRVASWAGALIASVLLACATQAPPPPAPPPPPPAPPLAAPCEVVTGPTVTITVDRQAAVDKPCVEIKKGKTDVVWTGTADVKYLLIAFKPGSDAPPDDPTCAAATCTLEKVKHAAKQGDFFYSVVVVLQDGSTATVDPKLIIQP